MNDDEMNQDEDVTAKPGKAGVVQEMLASVLSGYTPDPGYVLDIAELESQAELLKVLKLETERDYDLVLLGGQLFYGWMDTTSAGLEIGCTITPCNDLEDDGAQHWHASYVIGNDRYPIYDEDVPPAEQRPGFEKNTAYPAAVEAANYAQQYLKLALAGAASEL